MDSDSVIVYLLEPTGLLLRKVSLMAMTKKDYELIAKAITDSRYLGDQALTQEYQSAINNVTLRIAGVLADTNPRFDSMRFFSACQFGKLPRVSEVA